MTYSSVILGVHEAPLLLVTNGHLVFAIDDVPDTIAEPFDEYEETDLDFQVSRTFQDSFNAFVDGHDAPQFSQAVTSAQVCVQDFQEFQDCHAQELPALSSSSRPSSSVAAFSGAVACWPPAGAAVAAAASGVAVSAPSSKSRLSSDFLSTQPPSTIARAQRGGQATLGGLGGEVRREASDGDGNGFGDDGDDDVDVDGVLSDPAVARPRRVNAQANWQRIHIMRGQRVSYDRMLHLLFGLKFL